MVQKDMIYAVLSPSILSANSETRIGHLLPPILQSPKYSVMSALIAAWKYFKKSILRIIAGKWFLKTYHSISEVCRFVISEIFHNLNSFVWDGFLFGFGASSLFETSWGTWIVLKGSEGSCGNSSGELFGVHTFFYNYFC